MTQLNIEKLTFAYQSLKFDFSLTVQQGDIVALVGPSGAGKSTLLHLVAGLSSPISGCLDFGVTSLLPLAPYQRPISILFQEHNLFTHLTVEQNIGLGISTQLKLDAHQRQQLLWAAEQVGLQDKLKRYPGELSGGQKQRVALARCLVQNHPIWLLDEPFSALDPMLRDEMLVLVKSLAKSHGRTIIMVTHQISDAQAIASHYAYLDQGKIQASGEITELSAM